MTNSGDILYQEKEIDVLLHLCLYTPKFKHIQQLIVMEKQFVQNVNLILRSRGQKKYVVKMENGQNLQNAQVSNTFISFPQMKSACVAIHMCIQIVSFQKKRRRQPVGTHPSLRMVQQTWTLRFITMGIKWHMNVKVGIIFEDQQK